MNVTVAGLIGLGGLVMLLFAISLYLGNRRR